MQGDGFRFTMRDRDTRATIFQGDLVEQRCEGRRKDGAQCLRHVTKGTPFCHQHRGAFKVKRSSIPKAGDGLFVTRPTPSVANLPQFAVRPRTKESLEN
jgi:hypothetical protein